MKRKGFTLIELLVVIAVIALLLSVILPSLQKAKEYARRVTCSTNQRGLAQAVFVYAENNDGEVPPVNNFYLNPQMQRYAHWGRWFRTTSGGSSDYWNLGFLWDSNLIDQGKVFYCHSKQAFYKYEDYAAEGFPTDVQLGAGSASGVRVSYFYNPKCELNQANEYTRINTKTVDFSSQNILILDVLSSGGASHGDGWNVTKGDCSVSFVKDPEILRIMKEAPDFETNYTVFDEILRLLNR